MSNTSSTLQGANLTTSRQSPVVDFTSADFDSINNDLTTYAQANFSDRWTDFNADQFAVVFKEMIAYLGDLLCYQINSTIRETFSATALRIQNLANIGKTFNYVIPGPQPATVVASLYLDPAGAYPATIAVTDQYGNAGTGSSQVIFQPDVAVTIPSYPSKGFVYVDMTEGVRFFSVLIGVSDGTPNQRWQFPQTGVLASGIAIVVGAVTWTNITNFTNATATGQVAKIVQTDDGNTYALFGDSVYGAIPASGQNIYATFRVGGGSRGNLPAGQLNTKIAANAVVLSVTNEADADGGEDAPTINVARNGIPATLSTLERAVTADDYEQLATLIPGVAAARSGPGVPAGTRTIRVWIAPAGGGTPTPQLLSTVSATLGAAKMVTNRLQLFPPFYKQIYFSVLLHVNNSYKATDVQQAAVAGISNSSGTGLLDFAQLDFQGIEKDPNGETELLITQTRLQAYFQGLSTSGLDRAEIQALTVLPVARSQASGNTGNGSIVGLTTTSRQRRRQFLINMQSATVFAVYEMIVGTVTGLTDTVMTDDNEVFDNEGVSSFAGYLLVPNTNQFSTSVSVVSATAQSATVSSVASLFTLTEVGNDYFLYNPLPTVLTVGQTFTSADGNVSFGVASGSSPFVAADSFTIDVYPLVGDIELFGADEFPVLSSANFLTRTSGGSRV